MVIHGLQKLTLLDYPGKVACTVFIAGCNFRCPFCHNSELIGRSIEPVTDDTKFLAFLKKRQGVLDAAAITGGEPLTERELPSLLEKIKALGFLVKLDTNGSYPERLREVLDAGLVDYVAMDIKNSPERYAETVGRPDLDLAPIRQSVSMLMQGATDYEFRTTVVDELHDEASFEMIAEWIAGAKHYFLQNFEDRDTVLEKGLHSAGREKLLKYAEIISKQIPSVEIRGI